jgi:hypothetical protein
LIPTLGAGFLIVRRIARLSQPASQTAAPTALHHAI